MSLTAVEQNIICHSEQIAALTTRTDELLAGINSLESQIAALEESSPSTGPYTIAEADTDMVIDWSAGDIIVAAMDESSPTPSFTNVTDKHLIVIFEVVANTGNTFTTPLNITDVVWESGGPAEVTTIGLPNGLVRFVARFFHVNGVIFGEMAENPYF